MHFEAILFTWCWSSKQFSPLWWWIAGLTSCPDCWCKGTPTSPQGPGIRRGHPRKCGCPPGEQTDPEMAGQNTSFILTNFLFLAFWWTNFIGFFNCIYVVENVMNLFYFRNFLIGTVESKNWWGSLNDRGPGFITIHHSLQFDLWQHQKQLHSCSKPLNPGEEISIVCSNFGQGAGRPSFKLASTVSCPWSCNW